MMLYPSLLIETPKMIEPNESKSSSELISEFLTDMKIRGVQYRRIQTGPTFGLGLNSRKGYAYFYYLAVGNAVLRTSDGSVYELSAGNTVFMLHGDEHQLMSDLEVSFRDIEEFDAKPLGESVSGIDTCPSTHDIPSTILFYGCMEFDLGGMHELGKLIPDVMIIEADEDHYPQLLPIIDAMKGEICSVRIGYAGILARLAEVATSMAVRGWIESGCGDGLGLFAAIRDPSLARAILALHRNPGHNWTVAKLASESNSSRSVFARKFQSTLGIPPLRYVTEVRMHLASQWLSYNKLSIDEIAHRLGYHSQAAFSRAFKRVNGKPPGESRVKQ